MLHTVDEAVIDLVRIDDKVVLVGETRESFDVILGQHRARRVVGKAEQDRACARSDRGLDVLGPEPEVMLLFGRNRHGHAAGEDDAG